MSWTADAVRTALPGVAAVGLTVGSISGCTSFADEPPGPELAISQDELGG